MLGPKCDTCPITNINKLIYIHISGCGKSNLFEAIAFGLGISFHELRVASLKDISGDTNPDGKISVSLSFSNKTATITLESYILNNQRGYVVDNNKFTKLEYDNLFTFTFNTYFEKRLYSISDFLILSVGR